MTETVSASEGLLTQHYRGWDLAIVLYRVSHSCTRLGIVGWPFAKMVHWISRAVTSCDIDPRARIEKGVRVPHSVGVVIGETTTIGAGTIVMPGVVIGARVIGDTYKRHADVGRNVLIGAGAKILGAVRVGDGAQIGANSVVLRDVPAGAKVFGIPATVAENKDA